MTLPDSEIERMAIKSSEKYPQYPNGDKSLNQDINAHRKQKAFVEGAYYEALLWLERMGKFAEWVRGEGFQYLGGIWSSYKYNRSFTTPELINEFLKIK